MPPTSATRGAQRNYGVAASFASNRSWSSTNGLPVTDATGPAGVGPYPKAKPLGCPASSPKRLADTVTLLTTTTPAAQFRRCAIVGSSSSMRGKGLGPEIDDFDTVIRINRLPGPEHYADFGTKTDVFFAEPGFSSQHNWQPSGYWVENMGSGFPGARLCNWSGGPTCPFGALILKGADYPVVRKNFSKRFPLDRPGWKPPDSTVFPFGYQKDIVNHVAFLFRALHGKVPTNGFHAFLTFAPICSSLRLYGFSGDVSYDGHQMGIRHAVNIEHDIIGRIIHGDKTVYRFAHHYKVPANAIRWLAKKLAERARAGCLDVRDLSGTHINSTA